MKKIAALVLLLCVTVASGFLEGCKKQCVKAGAAVVIPSMPVQAASTITGGCDERGSRAYNHRLGFRRAYAVRDMLKAHLNDVTLKVASTGEDAPVCSDHTEGCWAKNRRVEIRVD